MALVGIISDTHGRLDGGALAALDGCDAIVHAGDICDPGILLELGLVAPVHAVLGNNDYDEYGPEVDYYARFVIEGVRFLVAHYPRDVQMPGLMRAIAPGQPLPQVCIHGHTHVPRIVTGPAASPAQLLMCPGSASRPREGSPRCVGKVKISQGTVVDAWIEDFHGTRVC